MNNLCLNGEMEVDQVNEGMPVILHGNGAQYGCDGWRGLCTSTGSGRIAVQRINDAPPGLSHSLKLTVQSPASSVSAGDYLALHSMIGAEQMGSIAYGTASAKTSSVSFWVKSSIAGRFGMNIANVDGARTYVRTFQISTANTWTYIALDNIPGCTDGTWPKLDLWGYMVFFACCGSTYQTATAGAWMQEDFGSTPEQTNTHLLTPGSTFQITGINHTIGKTSVPYARNPDELRRCQQRYEKSYKQGIAPGSITEESHGCSYKNGSPSVVEVAHTFSVEKMSKPHITLYSPATGTSGLVRDNCAGKDITPTVFSVDTHEFSFGVSALAKPADIKWHWVADCRL